MRNMNKIVGSHDILFIVLDTLRYVDSQLPRLFKCMQKRNPVFCIICSDHGTAYGEDGYTGHRAGHEVVWTVPYSDFILPRIFE